MVLFMLMAYSTDLRKSVTQKRPWFHW